MPPRPRGGNMREISCTSRTRLKWSRTAIPTLHRRTWPSSPRSCRNCTATGCRWWRRATGRVTSPARADWGCRQAIPAAGLGGGARAAHLVVERFEAVMKNVSSAEATSEMLCSFLRELDGRIQRDPDAGESTAVVAVILDGQVVGASVGDSEAWMV